MDNSLIIEQLDRLTSLFLPGLAAQKRQSYQSYLLRLLSSSFQQQPLDEGFLQTQVNMKLQARMKQESSDRGRLASQTTRVQSLLAQWGRQRMVTKKKEVIGLILSLADQKVHSVSQPLFSGQDRMDLEIENAFTIKDTLPTHSVPVANNTFPQLVRQLIYMMQGISSPGLSLTSEGHFVLSPDQAMLLPATVRAQVDRLCSIGYLYCQVQQLARDHSALQLGVQEELRQFYKFIAVLENQANNSQVPSLRQLYFWAQEPLERLEVLCTTLRLCVPEKNGQVLSILWQMTQRQSAHRSLYALLLRHASSGLLHFLSKWLSHGELVDPEGDFFIRQRGVSSWEDNYYLDLQRVPSFIHYDTALLLLETGRSVQYLKQYMNQSPRKVSRFQSGTHPYLQYQQSQQGQVCLGPDTFLTGMPCFQSELHTLHASLGRKVLQTVCDYFDLKGHLSLINRYMLMSQGDFLQRLLNHNGLQQELSRPSEKIAIHYLQSMVDKVVQDCDSSVASRLQVVTVRGKVNETGWDTVSLRLVVPEQLQVILGDKQMQDYSCIYRWLLKIKRAQTVVKRAFRHLKGDSRVVRLFQQSRQMMGHFVNTIGEYLMVQVVDQHWQEFLRSLSSARSLGQVISTHQSLLDTLMERLFLTDGHLNLHTQLSALFSHLHTYHTLLNYFLINQQPLNRSTDSLDSYHSADTLFSCNQEFVSKVSTLHAEFTRETLAFVGMLKQDASLHQLYLQMDFNDFFDEINSRKQKEHYNQLYQHSIKLRNNQQVLAAQQKAQQIQIEQMQQKAQQVQIEEMQQQESQVHLRAYKNKYITQTPRDDNVLSAVYDSNEQSRQEVRPESFSRPEQSFLPNKADFSTSQLDRQTNNYLDLLDQQTAQLAQRHVQNHSQQSGTYQHYLNQESQPQEEEFYQSIFHQSPPSEGGCS